MLVRVELCGRVLKVELLLHFSSVSDGTARHVQALRHCSMGQVGHGPPKILVSGAIMQLASSVIGLYI